MKAQDQKHVWHLSSLRLLLGLVVLFSLTGCPITGEEAAGAQQAPAGDPDEGWVALQAYGCQSCHTIPGVPGANSLVGPPLTAWAERSYIAGRLTNEPQYLVEWIRFPQAIEPGTAMPNLGVSEEDALDMAAYLYTLRRDQTWYVGLLRLLRIYD
ncbi:MAG: hypothetical protein R3E79_15120 [Caldilineaceae bacterium]